MLYKKFIKDLGIVSLTNFATAFRGIFIMPIITKLLGAESYGIWIQVIVTLSLVSSVITFGLPSALVRFLPAKKDEKEIQDEVYAVIGIIILSGLILSAVLSIFSSPISVFFGGKKVIVEALALTIVFECLNVVLLSLFRAFQEIKKYSLFFIFQVFGEVLLVSIAAISGYGISGVIWSLLIIRFINFLIMGGIIARKITIKIPKFSAAKEYLQYGLPVAFGSISYWIVDSSDKYLVGFFLGTKYVGYYAPAYTISGFLSFLYIPLSFLLPAFLAKLYDENKMEQVKLSLEYALKCYLIIAIPAIFGISVLSKPLLLILSTPEIAQHGYSVIPIIAFSTSLIGANIVFAQIIGLTKKTSIGGIIVGIAALANLSLNFIFIPKFGIVGAALTTLAANALILILTRHYAFKDFKFSADYRFVLKSIFASALMSVIIARFEPKGIIETLIAVVTGGFLYGILIFLLKGLSEKEIKLLKNTFLSSSQ